MGLRDEHACGLAPSLLLLAGLPITIGVPSGRSGTVPGFTFSYAAPVVVAALTDGSALVGNGGPTGLSTVGQTVTVAGSGFGAPALGNATVVFAGAFTAGLPAILSQADGALQVRVMRSRAEGTRPPGNAAKGAAHPPALLRRCPCRPASA